MRTWKTKTLLYKAFLLLLFACHSSVFAQVELRVSHYLPETHGIHQDLMLPWAAEIEEASDGQVSVTLYSGSSRFGKITRQAKQVERGIVDIALGLNGLPRNRYPASSLIEMPFLARDAQAATDTLWSLYQSGDLANEYSAYKVLALFTHQPGLIHTTKKPIQSIADLQDLNLRTPSIAVSESLKALGVNPISMAPGSIKEKLESGGLDGLVTTWDFVYSFDLLSTLKYHTHADTHVAAFHLLMNQDSFDALPPAIQDIVVRVSQSRFVDHVGALWKKWDNTAKDEAVRLGNKIHSLSEAQRKKWSESTVQSVDEYVRGVAEYGVSDPVGLYQTMVEKLSSGASSE